MNTKKNITQKVVSKAKKRGWKTIIGTALNAGSVPLLTMPDMTLKLIGVFCLAAGSALLAWDDGEKEEKELKGYDAYQRQQLSKLINNKKEKSE